MRSFRQKIIDSIFIGALTALLLQELFTKRWFIAADREVAPSNSNLYVRLPKTTDEITAENFENCF